MIIALIAAAALAVPDTSRASTPECVVAWTHYDLATGDRRLGEVEGRVVTACLAGRIERGEDTGPAVRLLMREMVDAELRRLGYGVPR